MFLVEKLLIKLVFDKLNLSRMKNLVTDMTIYFYEMFVFVILLTISVNCNLLTTVFYFYLLF